TWWVGTVIDQSGVETTIGALRAPRGTGLVSGSASFTEYFSTACPAPASSGFFLAPAALDFYSPIYGTHGSPAGQQPGVYSRITRGYGGVVLELGTTLPGTL